MQEILSTDQEITDNNKNMISESKFESIGTKYYCSYCGKELIPEIHWEEYTSWHTVECDCQGALLEKQANELLAKAEKLKEKKKIEELRYKEELKELNYKYGKR